MQAAVAILQAGLGVAAPSAASSAPPGGGPPFRDVLRSAQDSAEMRTAAPAGGDDTATAAAPASETGQAGPVLGRAAVVAGLGTVVRAVRPQKDDRHATDAPDAVPGLGEGAEAIPPGSATPQTSGAIPAASTVAAPCTAAASTPVESPPAPRRLPSAGPGPVGALPTEAGPPQSGPSEGGPSGGGPSGGGPSGGGPSGGGPSGGGPSGGGPSGGGLVEPGSFRSAPGTPGPSIVGFWPSSPAAGGLAPIAPKPVQPGEQLGGIARAGGTGTNITGSGLTGAATTATDAARFWSAGARTGRGSAAVPEATTGITRTAATGSGTTNGETAGVGIDGSDKSLAGASEPRNESPAAPVAAVAQDKAGANEIAPARLGSIPPPSGAGSVSAMAPLPNAATSVRSDAAAVRVVSDARAQTEAMPPAAAVTAVWSGSNSRTAANPIGASIPSRTPVLPARGGAVAAKTGLSASPPVPPALPVTDSPIPNPRVAPLAPAPTGSAATTIAPADALFDRTESPGIAGSARPAQAGRKSADGAAASASPTAIPRTDASPGDTAPVGAESANLPPLAAPALEAGPTHAAPAQPAAILRVVPEAADATPGEAVPLNLPSAPNTLAPPPSEPVGTVGTVPASRPATEAPPPQAATPSEDSAQMFRSPAGTANRRASLADRDGFPPPGVRGDGVTADPAAPAASPGTARAAPSPPATQPAVAPGLPPNAAPAVPQTVSPAPVPPQVSSAGSATSATMDRKAAIQGTAGAAEAVSRPGPATPPDGLTFAAPTPTPAEPTAVAAAPASAAGGTGPAAQLAPALLTMAKSTDGSQQMTVRLHPAELGMVQIRIDRAVSGATQIDIAADRPETLLALQRDQPALHRTLDEAGIPVAGRTVAFHVLPHSAGSTGTGSGQGSGQQSTAGRWNNGGTDGGGSSGGGGAMSGGRDGYLTGNPGRWPGGRATRTPAATATPAQTGGGRTQSVGLDITA